MEICKRGNFGSIYKYQLSFGFNSKIGSIMGKANLGMNEIVESGRYGKPIYHEVRFND